MKGCLFHPDNALGRHRSADLMADLQRAIVFLETRVMDLEAAALRNGKGPKFSAEDSEFLILVLGFMAGANLERDGERGERIFARFRDLHQKLQGSQGNPS